MLIRETRNKPAINLLPPFPLTGERVSLPAEALAKVGEGVRGKKVSSTTLEKGGEGGFEQGKREGNVVASPFTGGGLGQVECLGRGRPLAGKGVIPLKEGKREDNIAMPLPLKPIKGPARLQCYDRKDK